jgi:hypothetical protein
MVMSYTITAVHIDPTLPFEYRKVHLYTIATEDREELTNVINWCKETFPSDWGSVDTFLNPLTNTRGYYLWFKKNDCLTAFLLKYQNGHSHN